MKVLDEIKKVGLIDWAWWVFYCERDEFHPRLSSSRIPICGYKNPEFLKEQRNLIKDRERAHRIDMEIG